MKKMVFALGMCLLSFVNANAQSNAFQKLIGKWVISSDDQPAYLEIIDTSNIILTYQGETRKCDNVKINLEKSPYWFDFTSGTGDSIIHVKTIIELFDNGVAKWQLFVDEERTPFFTASKGEILYLQKSKNAVITAANSR